MIRARRRTTALAALALVCAPAAAQGETLFDGRLTLPEGRVADALRRTGAGEPAAWSAELWPDWRGDGAGWDAEPPWRQWVELVRAEAAAERADAGRRARLAHLARLQERDADAWRHLARVDDPGLVAAVLPLFLPGVSPTALGRDGLAPGVLLRPALPPPRDDSDGTLRSLVGRPVRVERVRVGESLIALSVVIDPDGVQVDLEHQAGPPVEVRVAPPVPPGVTLGILYANWERVEDPLAPVTVRLEDSEDLRKVAVWGRFRPREERWPKARPGPHPAPHAALELVWGGPPRPRLARFAEALEELFRRPCTLVPAAGRSDAVFEPVRLDFGDGSEPAAFTAKFRSMISLAERWALAGAGAGE